MKGLSASIRFLMVFWYLSVGVRIAFMFFTHLPPEVGDRNCTVLCFRTTHCIAFR